ncbi:MAG: glycoside hydrolase family 16 protein [Candidatus Dormibacteraeota bacterium]|nr:glycoside hydrolase family 16 protein [Candidatus Dormibacteraeota bacterium]
MGDRSWRIALALVGVVFLSITGCGSIRGGAPSPGGPASAGGIVQHGPPGQWKAIFDSEFEGTSLDETRWTTCSPQLRQNPCSGWGSELETYRPENVTVSGGELHLTARRAGDGSYSSGMVSTGALTGGPRPGYRPFSFQYGYYEVALRPPPGQGLWTAAWAFGTDLIPPFELDDVEVFGSDPHTAMVTSHYPGANRDSPGQLSQHLTGPDYSAGMHTFGVDWEPDHVTWYVDGVAAPQSITNRADIPAKPMFLMLDLAVGGDFPGPPSAQTRFPASLDVDYVRVFKPA